MSAELVKASIADQVRASVRLHRDLPPPATRKALREDAGLSQQELASIVGCARASIAYWETTDRAPRGALLPRYVEALRALRDAA